MKMTKIRPTLRIRDVKQASWKIAQRKEWWNRRGVQKRGMESKRKQLGTKNKEFYQKWLKRKIRNTSRRFKERPAKG